MSDWEASRPETRVVAAGEDVAPPRPPATPPIYQTAPFLFRSVADLDAAFEEPSVPGLYSRYASPNAAAVEAKVAMLEGAAAAVAFGSGMAAIAATLSALLEPGGHVVMARELYGGTTAFAELLGRRNPGVTVEPVPLDTLGTRLDAVPAPDLVWVETPTNPLLRSVALEPLAARCRAAGALLVVDNTFATPVLQRPLSLGADLVVHSATKYLGGHSDVTAGVVAGPAARLEPLLAQRRLAGAMLDPHAAFLLNRGIKTLFLRVERQSANAARLAAALAAHPAVPRVYYPGDDPVARAQMSAGGGMLSFELADLATATRVVERLVHFRLLPSLGGLESSAMLPAITSHRGIPPDERRAQGITDGLVRLSVGIEAAEDLVADLENALAPESGG